MSTTDKGYIFNAEQVAAVVAKDTKLQAENEVRRTFIELQGAEGNSHEKGLAFGRAMIKFREENPRNWMKALEALRLPGGYHKAKYWINEVEGTPNNRHLKYDDDRYFCVTQNSKGKGRGGKWSLPRLELKTLKSLAGKPKFQEELACQLNEIANAVAERYECADRYKLQLNVCNPDNQ
jgi:hypothetical protein